MNFKIIKVSGLWQGIGIKCAEGHNLGHSFKWHEQLVRMIVAWPSVILASPFVTLTTFDLNVEYWFFIVDHGREIIILCAALLRHNSVQYAVHCYKTIASCKRRCSSNPLLFFMYK